MRSAARGGSADHPVPGGARAEHAGPDRGTGRAGGGADRVLGASLVVIRPNPSGYGDRRAVAGRVRRVGDTVAVYGGGTGGLGVYHHPPGRDSGGSPSTVSTIE